MSDVLAEGFYWLFQIAMVVAMGCYISGMWTAKIKQWKALAIYIVGASVFAISAAVLDNRYIGLCTNVFNLVYWFSMYKGKTRSKLMPIVAMYAMTMISDFFSAVLGGIISFSSPNNRMIFSCAVCTVLFLGMLKVTSDVVKSAQMKIIGKKALWLLLVPLSQIFVFTAVAVYIHSGFPSKDVFLIWEYQSDIISGGLVLTAVVLCVVADIFALRGYIENASIATLESKVAVLEYQNEINLQYYSDMRENESDLRKIKHDFVNILQVVKSLMENGKTDDAAEAQRLYDSLTEEIGDIRLNDYCDNSLVNAILSGKLKKCKKAEIETDLDIRIPAELTIEDIDLCRVLVNLTDNAIEACEKLEQERFIKLDMFEKDGYLYIKTVNRSVDGGETDETSTTKADRVNHGFGTKILRDIAAKYEGEFIFSNESGKAISMISLNCVKNPIMN